MEFLKIFFRFIFQSRLVILLKRHWSIYEALAARICKISQLLDIYILKKHKYMHKQPNTHWIMYTYTDTNLQTCEQNLVE